MHFKLLFIIIVMLHKLVILAGPRFHSARVLGGGAIKVFVASYVSFILLYLVLLTGHSMKLMIFIVISEICC